MSLTCNSPYKQLLLQCCMLAWLLAALSCTGSPTAFAQSGGPSMHNEKLVILENTRKFSSCCTAASCFSPAPKRPLRAAPAAPRRSRSLISLFKAASTKSGTVSRRSVCPVGAVSKMMRENLAYSWLFTNSTTCALAMSGWAP